MVAVGDVSLDEIGLFNVRQIGGEVPEQSNLSAVSMCDRGQHFLTSLLY